MYLFNGYVNLTLIFLNYQYRLKLLIIYYYYRYLLIIGCFQITKEIELRNNKTC